MARRTESCRCDKHYQLNIVEAIIRRPIPEKAEGIITMIGFLILLTLMVLVTWNDIQRYFIR